MANLEKPITTQEEFDAAIGDRLKRDREVQAKKYEGWRSPTDFQKELAAEAAKKDGEIKALQDAAAKAAQEIADKDKALEESAAYKAALDRTLAAVAAGLDPKYADRLRGSNAEEWAADAAELAKDFATAHAVVPPLGALEPKPAAAPASAKELEREAFRSLVRNIEG